MAKNGKLPSLYYDVCALTVSANGFLVWIDNFRMIEEAMNTRRYSRPIAVERTFYEIYVPSGF